MAPVFENALHSLKGAPHVIDVRNIGLVGGIELEPIAAIRGAAHSTSSSSAGSAVC